MIAGLVLMLVVLLAGMSARWGAWGALGLAFVSVLWLVVNRGMEGHVLVSFGPDHGLTEADLAGLAGLVLATLRLRGAVRQEA